MSFCGKKSYLCTFSGSEMQRIGEKNALDLTPSIWMKDDNSSLVVDTWYNRPAEMNKIEQHIQEHQASTSSFQASSPFLNIGHLLKSKPFPRNFLRKYTRDLMAASIVSRMKLSIFTHFYVYSQLLLITLTLLF